MVIRNGNNAAFSNFTHNLHFLFPLKVITSYSWYANELS